MNDETNRSDIIHGIAGMIDNKVKVAVQEIEENHNRILRLERRVTVTVRNNMDELKQGIQTNTETVQLNSSAIDDLTDGMENHGRALKTMTETIEGQVSKAISAIENTPETDKKIADLETKVAMLEDKVQQMIEALSSVAYLSD